MLTTPVAFIIFRRLEFTERVMAAIAEIKPCKLAYYRLTAHARNVLTTSKLTPLPRAVIDCVDWDCGVIKNYSDVNLKCGGRVAGGITWVFEHVQESIILEDDCVPDPSFFRFSQELLER